MSKTGMQGFDDAGLALGTVTGVRWWNLSDGSWNLSDESRSSLAEMPALRGSMDYWQPGENVAVCKHSGSGGGALPGQVSFPVSGGQASVTHTNGGGSGGGGRGGAGGTGAPNNAGGIGYTASYQQAVGRLTGSIIATLAGGGGVGGNEAGRAGHEVPDEDCGCGFWAYWTREHTSPLGGAWRVLGVIDGYGTTLIGEKGFRCARARIVALCCMFTIEMPDPDWQGPQGPRVSPSFWHRGPQGKEAFEAFGGRPLDRAPMVPDLVQMAKIETALSERYGVPVYSSPGYMLTRHPLTTDYLPRPDPPGWDELLKVFARGMISAAELQALLAELAAECQQDLASLTSLLAAAPQRTVVVAGNYVQYAEWCRRHDVPPGRRHVIYATPQSLRGLSRVRVEYTGTWLQRRDLPEIEAQLAVIKLAG